MANLNLFDYVNANEVASYIDTLPSNREQYLGNFLFPRKNQVGMDISWLKGSEGLPVMIQPSNYDAKASLRERKGFRKVETEMAFYREGVRFGEKDRQQINIFMQTGNLGIARPMIENLFDDVARLSNGVDAMIEYQRMSLLQTGKFQVKSTDDTTVYEYDYSMKAENQVTPSNLWTNFETSDPVSDLKTMADEMESRTGVRPDRIIMNRVTFQNMVASESIRKNLMIGVSGNWQDFTISDNDARSYVAQKTDLVISVYSKQVGVFDDFTVRPSDELATAVKLVQDHKVIMIPPGTQGRSVFGTTPEESDLMTGNTTATVRKLGNGATVMSYTEPHPVNIFNVVSAVMVPTFEQIDRVAVLTVG